MLGYHMTMRQLYVSTRPLHLLVPQWLIFVGLGAIRVNEVILLALALVAVAITWLISVKGERLLFGVGLIFGVVAELILANIDRAQHWDNASLFGVPLWLPVIWGLSFIGIS